MIPQAVTDPSVKINCLLNPWSYQYNLRSIDSANRYEEFLDKVKPQQLFFAMYPEQGPYGDYRAPLPDNIDSFYFPSDQPVYVKEKFEDFFFEPSNNFIVSRSAYNLNIQSIWTKYVDLLEYFRNQTYSRNKDYVALIQLIHEHLDQYHPIHREPMNSEISAQSYIALCRGAKGLLGFSYDAFYRPPGSPSIPGGYGGSNGYYNGGDQSAASAQYVFGLTEFYDSLQWGKRKRLKNFYNESKWDFVKILNEKIKAGGYVFANSVNTQGYSVDRDGANHNFISDVKSFFRDESSPYSFNTSNEDAVRYWEMGFFYPDYPDANDKSKYFMMVNKRCVPDFIAAEGDVRQLKIKFDTTDLQGFNNWKLTDEFTGASLVFDKNNQGTGGFLDLGNTINSLGYFNPGEGKLYKIAPVMQEGGTLVAREDCGGFEFECRGEVNNDGHDVTIKPRTEVSFADPSARLIMSGGEFKSGLHDSPTAPVKLKAVSGQSWKGLEFGNCTSVQLFNTEFRNVAPYPVDSTYAVEIVDCENTNLSSCKFYSESAGETGAVLLSFLSNSDPPMEPSVYLADNLFKMGSGSIPAVSIVATGSAQVPAILEWNNFESDSGSSALAVFLSNIAGGAIKENNFTGYDKTIFMLGSSMDVYGNYIIGSDQSSRGIIQYAGSNAILSPVSEIFTGGYNYISVEGTTAKCMELTNSYLLFDEGYNTFRLEDSQTGNYHLEGTIPNDIGADPYPAENNCFQIGNGLLVKHNLRWIDESPINPDTVPSSCNSESPENLLVFELGNGISDTLHYSQGGSGSGAGISAKDISKSALSPEETQTVSVKSLKDTVTINLRKRNYDIVSASCRELLTTFADSISDASLISKLYLAELKLDESHTGLSDLKSFLESYILNYPEKEMMIRQAFYFIQKCKVTLGLYESAMSGFQQIINQFPYSYEGLLASWDYAAVSLLNSQGGSGGGINSTSATQAVLYDETENYADDPNDAYDIKKFSPDDRRALNQNLLKTFTTLTEKQTREIKVLEEKITKSEATDTEKKKYAEMKTLKEVVKARKPETVAMHLSMITDDLSRIMKSAGGDVSEKVDENIIPDEFALHQNYPNPFNPSTRIAFDLPRDSRVTLIVYDLLGREMTRILSNEFKAAGRYTYNFNGASLSSGVYFCRIQAGTFVRTKRMVLLK